MAARLWLWSALSALISVAGAVGRPAHAVPRDRLLEAWRVERDVRRFEVLNRRALWDVLAVRPGMSVLDVGTGTGQFAYAFAERVRERGMVYAADTNEACVAYVREEAARRGITNLVPLLAAKDGPDESHRAARYDLIAIFHVHLDHEKEIDLLRRLRDALAKDGRLVLLLYRGFPDFSADDLAGNPEELADEILREPEGAPFHRAFPAAAREALREARRAGSAAGLGQAIAAGFNAILADADFGMGFSDADSFLDEVAFTPDERAYAEWLTIPNNRPQVERGSGKATWVSARNARMINKLLIVQKYRRHLSPGTLYAPGLSSAGRGAFSRAGYLLLGEYADLVPFEDVVVFGRGR